MPECGDLTMSIRIVALLAVVAGTFLVPSTAQAGLFGCRKAAACCEPAPVCCEPAPVCCEVSSCDPCGRPRLLGCLRGRAAKSCCAAPSCCAPAPVCCEPAPVCCEPAPAPVCCEPAPVCCEPVSCCDAAPSCGCETSCCGGKGGLLSRLKARKASRHSCGGCDCGCHVASSCGCGCN